MAYTTKDGKQKNAYLMSGNRQSEMVARGWRVRVTESYRETEQELYDRLSEYYSDVRIYKASTRVRGCYNTFAMCR